MRAHLTVPHLAKTVLSGRRIASKLRVRWSLVFIAAGSALLAPVTALDSLAANKEVVNVSASPHIKIRTIGLDEAHWTTGFWADRWELDRTVTIPTMKAVMERPDSSATFQNFRVAAGEVQGKFSGNAWSDGDCYKWIEAAASMYALTKDPELDKQMDEKIALIEKCMAPDGYISLNIQLDSSANQKPKSKLWTDGFISKYLPLPSDKKERWSDISNHELYNMGHLMTAACIHHRVTGKDNFFKVACKVGDYLYSVFEPKPKELAHMDFNPANIMAAVELYRTTKEKKYLDLADIFVTMRGSQPGGSDLFQSKVPLRKEVEAVGHGVTSTYLWAGAADVVAETGEPALLESLKRLWEDVVNKKMYIHGGISALHHGESHRDLPFPNATKGEAGATPNAGDLMAVATRNRSPESKPNSVHESFGMAYQLPNRTAYNETCGSIGNAMWNWRMLCLTGDAKYADVMERVFYNGMISAISLDGSHYFYTNPLRRGAPEVPLLSQDAKQRWDRCGRDMPVNCFCCPPSLARTIAQLHTYAYGIAKDDVWVHLYGSSQLATKLPGGGEIQLAQTTDYPWDGEITLRIEKAPQQEMALHLRIPGWVEKPSLKINGKAASENLQPGSYCEFRQSWKAGDVVELSFPMPVELIQSNPLVEENRNQVAVMRGPLVYCLESLDLPKGVAIEEVAIARGCQWEVRHEAGLLNGVTVLETKGEALPRPTNVGALYCRLPSGKPAAVPLRLIPYYAWSNRGQTQMSVWLPLVR